MPGIHATWFESFRSKEECASMETANEAEKCVSQPSSGLGELAGPGPVRLGIAFSVIVVLLVAFGFAAFSGLSGSDWLYGTYGRISEAQWRQIAEFRDRLIQFGAVPEAVDALDNALLLPHPSTEQTLFDLREAVNALDRFEDHAIAQEIQTQLYALMTAIEQDYRTKTGPRPTSAPDPTLTPAMDNVAPVASGA